MSASHFRIAVLAAAMFAAGVLTCEGQALTPAPRAAGDQSRWRLTFTVRLEPADAKAPIEIRITGDWIVTVSALRTHEYDVTLQLSDASVSGAGVSTTSGDVASLEQRWSQPFWATYRSDGALLSIHFFSDVDPSDRNLLQMIATHGQLVDSATERPVWTALERDGAGSYMAVYHRPAPNVVAKRKLKYIDTDGVPGAPGQALRVAVEQSEFRFSLDRDGGVAALAGSERVRMFFPTSAADSAERNQLAALTEIHLANLRRSRSVELIGSLERARPTVVSSPIITHHVDSETALTESDKNLLNGHTTASLLEAAVATTGDRMLSDRLAALFRRRPEASAAALDVLRKGDARKQITDAMGAAASPPAIDALGRLAGDRTMSSALRRDALTALVLTQHPSEEAMRIPVLLLDDSDPKIRATARLVSGAVARAGRGELPTEADAIDAALIARFRKARDVEEITGFLGGLGNSVGPQAVTAIGEALRDHREVVRAAAARALRLAPGADVDRWLAAAITLDAHPQVRADAIFAAGFRRPVAAELGEALVHAAKNDTADYVRSNAVGVLRRNPDAHPGVADALAWVAEHDRKPGNRRLAREALTALSSR